MAWVRSARSRTEASRPSWSRAAGRSSEISPRSFSISFSICSWATRMRCAIASSEAPPLGEESSTCRAARPWSVSSWSSRAQRARSASAACSRSRAARSPAACMARSMLTRPLRSEKTTTAPAGPGTGVVEELVGGLADQLVLRPAEQLGGGRVGEGDSSALVGVVDALAGELEDAVAVAGEAVELGAGALEPLAPLGDVLDETHALERPALVVADDRHREGDPDDLAVLADVALVERVALALATEDLAREAQVHVAVGGMGDVREAEAGQLGGVVAGEAAEGLVDLGEAMVVADECHGDGAVGEHALEALAGLAERRLVALAAAEVAEGNGGVAVGGGG